MERIQLLKETIKSRSQLQDRIKASFAWLDNMQEQIRCVDVPVGHTVQDAVNAKNHLEVCVTFIIHYKS